MTRKEMFSTGNIWAFSVTENWCSLSCRSCLRDDKRRWMEAGVVLIRERECI